MKNKQLFLLAFYARRPRNPRLTYQPGYINNPDNFILDESINITRGLRTRDEINAGVILNLNDKKVIKNKFNDNKDFPSLLAHFQEGYPNYLNPLINQLYTEEYTHETHVQTEEKTSD
jgi:hypothetical protein